MKAAEFSRLNVYAHTTKIEKGGKNEEIKKKSGKYHFPFYMGQWKVATQTLVD